MKELGFLFVTQFMSLEPSKVTTQNGEEWGTFHRQFLIPKTATFCIAMDAKRNSSFAAKIKKGVRNMRSTFNILFYVNKSKEKNGVVPCGASNGQGNQEERPLFFLIYVHESSHSR